MLDWPVTELSARAWDDYADGLDRGIASGVYDPLAYGHLAETCREAARSIRAKIAVRKED